MNYTINIIEKRSWGRKRFYPACDLSRLMCDLIKHDVKRKAVTFTEWQIDRIKESGIKINYLQE